MYKDRKFTLDALKEIDQEKKILNSLKSYYVNKLTYDEISETGISISELMRYQTTNKYPHRSLMSPSALEELLSRVDDRVKELDQNYSEIQPNLLGSLNNLLVIPSWSKLIGKAGFNGFYLNKPVKHMISDNIIFLPDMALTGFEETMGEPFFLLTGLGVYYVKFGLSKGEIITDYREITGIVLPLDLYERAQDLSGQMVRSENLLMTEYMTSIPFSVIMAHQTQQMYLRGVIARNVIHPNKEVFELFLKLCKQEMAWDSSDGFKILSGGLSTKIPLYTNEILTEKVIPGYSTITAGLHNIQPKMDKIIKDLQINELRGQIFDKIYQMKDDFIKIGYPGLMDWVP